MSGPDAPDFEPNFEDVKRLLEGAVDAAIVVDSGASRPLSATRPTGAYAAKRPRQLAQLVEQGTPCHALFNMEICERECLMRRAAEVKRPLRMHEVRARRGDGAELTLIVTSTPIGGGLVVETYRDVTAESRLQRNYHTLLSRERVAKEELERQVGERTEALTRAQDQLVMTEKMSSLGRLVAGIAHELNNPINFVYGNVDFIADYFKQIIGLIKVYESSALPGEVRANAEQYKQGVDFGFLLSDWERLLRSIRAGAERTAQIVAGLKTFSRPQVGPLEDSDLVAGLETTLSLLAPVLRDIYVERDFVPLPPVRCRAGQVQQVFMNLLTNAAHASGAGGRIAIVARPDGPVRQLRGARQRPRRDARAGQQDLRPVLHHQRGGQGDRAGVGHLPAHHPRARRPHRAVAAGVVDAGATRRRIHRLAAAGTAGGAGLDLQVTDKTLIPRKIALYRPAHQISQNRE